MLRKRKHNSESFLIDPNLLGKSIKKKNNIRYHFIGKNIISTLTFLLITFLMTITLALGLITIYMGMETVKLQREGKNESTLTLFGYSFHAINSPSMVPTFSPNAFLIVKEQDNYYSQDIVAVQTPWKAPVYVTCHRIIADESESIERQIVGEVPGKKYGGSGPYLLKGDANNAPDKEVFMKKEVIGKVVYMIPNVGKYFLNGFYLSLNNMIMIGLTIIIFITLFVGVLYRTFSTVEQREEFLLKYEKMMKDWKKYGKKLKKWKKYDENE